MTTTERSPGARRAAVALLLLVGLAGVVAPAVGAAEGPVFHEDVAPQPLGVPSATRFPMTVGGSHSCTVDTNGGVTCWGQGDAGQLGRTLPDGRADLLDHRRADSVRYFGVYAVTSPLSPVPL